MKKGTMIQLKGRLNDRDIELSDNKKYKTYSVIAEEVEFAESKTKQDAFTPITDDDMPF